jgi:hypothetical protein
MPMKQVFRVTAVGPWMGGLEREFDVPADSREEASRIVREQYGATSICSVIPQGAYLDPGSAGRPVRRPGFDADSID